MASLIVFGIGLLLGGAKAFVVHPGHQLHGGVWSDMPRIPTWPPSSVFPHQGFVGPSFGSQHPFLPQQWHRLDYYRHPFIHQGFNFGPMPTSFGQLSHAIRHPLPVHQTLATGPLPVHRPPAGISGRTVRIGSSRQPVRHPLIARRRQSVLPSQPVRTGGSIPVLSEFRSSNPQVTRRQIIRERITRVNNGTRGSSSSSNNNINNNNNNNNKGNNNNNNNKRGRSSRRMSRHGVVRPDPSGTVGIVNGNEVLAIFALDQRPALVPRGSKLAKKSDLKVSDIHAAAKAALDIPKSDEDLSKKTIADIKDHVIVAKETIDSSMSAVPAYKTAEASTAEAVSVATQSIASLDISAQKESDALVVEAPVAKIVDAQTPVLVAAESVPVSETVEAMPEVATDKVVAVNPVIEENAESVAPIIDTAAINADVVVQETQAKDAIEAGAGIPTEVVKEIIESPTPAVTTDKKVVKTANVAQAGSPF